MLKSVREAWQPSVSDRRARWAFGVDDVFEVARNARRGRFPEGEISLLDESPTLPSLGERRLPALRATEGRASSAPRAETLGPRQVLVNSARRMTVLPRKGYAAFPRPLISKSEETDSPP
jgi:hypothetical protein